jgi:hypothetical protein
VLNSVRGEAGQRAGQRAGHLAIEDLKL